MTCRKRREGNEAALIVGLQEALSIKNSELYSQGLKTH
jgi:hypothetical protein